MPASTPVSSTTSPRRRTVGPGRPTQAEAERRLAHLLDVAERLFLERGYDACSLETIAREAQVAGRTIYAKFGGKAGLLSAAVERRAQNWVERARLLNDADADFETVLRAFAVDYLWEATRPETLALRRAVVAESTRLPEIAAAFHTAANTRMRKALAKHFDRPGMRARWRRDADADYLAGQCLHALLSHEYGALFFGMRKPPTRAQVNAWANAAIDLFLHGALDLKSKHASSKGRLAP